MKSYLKIFFTGFFCLIIFANTVSAKTVNFNEEAYINEKLASIGFGKYINKDPKDEIIQLFANIDKYSDSGDIRRLRYFFSKDFINNDGFDYNIYLKSVKEGADTITNRKSKTEILDINVFENYAIVHVKENGEATTVKESPDNLGKGILILNAEIYYTLQKEGRSWKILSANVVDEICRMLYGEAKNMYFSLNTPMQVKENSEYTATLSFNQIPGCVAMSSISSEPIIYPVPKNKDIYKTVKQDGVLERIFKANNSGYNDYVIASVGITKPEMLPDGAVNVRVIGTAYILKRVNIFSVSKSSLKMNTGTK